MSTTSAKTSPLASTNFWTNIVTIIVGVALAFFTPDLDVSGTVSAEVTNVVAAIKAANYGALITALFNLGNILWHLFKK